MIAPDPLRTIQRRASGYRKGIYTLMETVDSIISEVDENIARDAIASLSDELLEAVKQTVHAAPWTEEDWGRCYSIHGGIYRVPEGKTEADILKEHEQREKESRVKYREGIQVLRKFFGVVQQALDK
jgi:hypothetical protein